MKAALLEVVVPVACMAAVAATGAFLVCAWLYGGAS